MSSSSFFQRNLLNRTPRTKYPKTFIFTLFISIFLFFLIGYGDLLRRANESLIAQGNENQTNSVIPVSVLSQDEYLHTEIPTSIPITCDYEDSMTKSRYCLLKKLIGPNPSERKSAQDYITQKAKQHGHYISTCTAVRAAGDMIHEFIVRNYLAGVDHFFMFDDDEKDAKDNITQLLKELSPLVTITKPPTVNDFLKRINRTGEIKIWAIRHRQHMLYWHCFLTYGKRSKWLLPIDADEFLEAKHPEKHDTKNTVFEDTPFMQEYLRKIEYKAPAQIARWTSVFTNNRIFPLTPEGQTLAESYPMTCGRKDTFRTHSEAGELFSAKTAVQPGHLDYNYYQKIGEFFVHGIRHWGWDKGAQELAFVKPFEKFQISINTTETEWTILHYWSRSLSDYALKKARGRLSGLRRRSLSELIDRETKCRKYGKWQVSESARRRTPIVRRLVNEIFSFSVVQKRYYHTIFDAFEEDTSNDTSVFKEWLISQGEHPA